MEINLQVRAEGKNVKCYFKENKEKNICRQNITQVNIKTTKIWK